MRFGINTFLFASPFTNRNARLFSVFKSWGFDSVEIALEDAAHIDAAFVKKQLARHGLVCGSIAGCFGPGRDLRGSPSEQRAASTYVMRLLEQMSVLECPALVGPIYSAVGRAEAVSRAAYRQQWRTVVKNLKPLCRAAEKSGAAICLEPLNRYETDFINTCDQALEMIDDVGSPALKILLDTFHMNIEEKCPAEAILKAGRRLGHFHACGCDRGTPGRDRIDWPGIARALRKIRYKGDAVIESFTTDVQIIARAAAIWRRIEPSRDGIARDGLVYLRKTLV